MFICVVLMVLAVGLLLISLSKNIEEETSLICKFISVGVFLISAGVFGYNTYVLVPAGHQAVLLRFGAVNGTLNEGLHFINPLTNRTVDMEVRTQKVVADASAASKDLQNVQSKISINYHLDPSKVGVLYQKVGPDYVERIIDPAVQESLKAATAEYTAEELIKLRSTVKTQVDTDIANRLKAYNIIVEDGGVSLTDFSFSEDFNKAIETKQIAQQKAEQQKYVLQEAKTAAETTVTKARAEADAAILNAKALSAQGSKTLLMKQWIEKWNGDVPKVNSGSSGFMISLKDLEETKG